MLHLAQGFQGAAEEGGLPSTGGGKKVTPVMPDSKESGHEDGSPGRKSEVIRRILQQKKVGTDILVEGQKESLRLQEEAIGQEVATILDGNGLGGLWVEGSKASLLGGSESSN